MKHLLQKTFALKALLLMSLLVGAVSGAWAEEKTFDFSFTTIGTTGWSNSYAAHSYIFDEGTVKFTSASKQTGTITTVPVTKGQPVEFVMKEGYSISAATFTCKQWSSKAQTITLHYSTDGGENYTSTNVTSSNFSITKGDLPSGTNAVKITFSSNSNQVGIESATITYSESTSSSAVATTVTIDTDGITNTDIHNGTDAGSLAATVSVTDGDAIDGAIVSWSGDNDKVATIDATTGAVTLIGVGTVNFTAIYAGVENEYKSSSKSYEMTVTNTDPNQPGTENNPYSVADAITQIKSGNTESYYVTGIISKITSTSVLDGGYLTYYISDDGTVTNQLQVYKGKGLNNAEFTAVSDIALGDKVIVYGPFLYYNNKTPEINTGNYLIDLVRKTIPTLTFGEESYNVGVNESLTITASSTESDGAITYTSSKTEIADIDPTTGEVLAYQAGSTTITATIAETNTYKSTTAEVTLTVTDNRPAVTIITALEPTTVYVGQSGTFTLTETTAGEATYAYSSDDDEVLLVDGNEFVGVAPGEVSVSVTATPKANNYSAANFEADITVAYKYAAPSISDDTFTGTTSITIPAIDGATIYYTLDGKTPTAESTAYTEAIELDATTTIKAIAIDANGCVSPVATATYTKEAVKKDAIVLAGGETLSFTDFSNLGGYANDRDDYVIASDGNAYKWTGKQYCYNNDGYLQMRAKGNSNGTGTLNLPTITTPNGVTLSLVFTENATPIVYLKGEEESLTATSKTSTSAVFVIESTSANFIIEAGGKATYITSISVKGNRQASTLAFAEDTQTLIINETATYAATASREGEITYKSSDENIAMIDANTGEVMGIAEGVVTITATLADNADYEGATATYTLNVVDKIRTEATIAFGETPETINIGETATYAATTNSDATITYESNNTKAVTVDENGMITAVAKGIATITASVAQTDNFTAASTTYTIQVVNPNEDIFNIATIAATNNWERGKAISTIEGNTCSLEFSKATGTSSPAFFDNAIRFYSKNTLTIESASKAIASVAITFDGTMTDFVCQTDNYNAETESSTITYTAEAGKAIDEVVFYRDATKGNNPIKEIVVAYTDLETTTIERTMANESWGTICVEGKVKASRIDGATIYSIAGKRINSSNDPIYIILEEVTEMEAGTPYIFQATADEQSFTYATSTAVEEAGSNKGLVGSFAGTSVAEGMYLLSGGQVVKCGTGCSIGTNRAYIDMSKVEVVDAEVKGIKIFLEGSADAIRSLDADSLNGAAIYDLSGRRLNKAQKGLYIVNGKKVNVK